MLAYIHFTVPLRISNTSNMLNFSTVRHLFTFCVDILSASSDILAYHPVTSVQLS